VTISAFVCVMPHWETLGMIPCPRCGVLTYADCPEDCDLTPAEREIEAERQRRTRWTPDASDREVRRMLNDRRGTVAFVDPLVLYEGDDREESLNTITFPILDGWIR
jgi:uncharacterized Zn finger protein (UPF0148 family)